MYQVVDSESHPSNTTRGFARSRGTSEFANVEGTGCIFCSTRSQSFALKSEASRDENFVDTSSVSIA